MLPIQIRLGPALVGGIAAFMIGGLWYGPLFGKAWLAARGLPADHRLPPSTYVVGLVCFVALAGGLSVLSAWAGVERLGEGLMLGTVVWLGVAFALGLNGAFFAGTSLAGFGIDAGYQLVVLLGLGAMLGVWR